MSYENWDDTTPVLLWTGDMVRGCEVLKWIGEGSFSKVYLVRDATGRECALKVNHHAVDDLGLPLFHEANIMRHYGVHEGLPRFYDAWEEDGSAYILMESVRGMTYYQLVQCWHWPVPKLTICCVLLKLLDVLHHVHTLPDPVYHLDISAKNLFITGIPGRLTLIDFGIAQCASVGVWRPKYPTAIFGTLSFMPPERLVRTDDQKTWLDPRSDLYAVALIGYRLVGGRKHTRRLPLMEEDIVPPPISENKPHADLVRIINRAIAKNPEDRYPTAKAFMEALLNVL